MPDAVRIRVKHELTKDAFETSWFRGWNALENRIKDALTEAIVEASKAAPGIARIHHHPDRTVIEVDFLVSIPEPSKENAPLQCS